MVHQMNQQGGTNEYYITTTLHHLRVLEQYKGPSMYQ